MAVRKLFAKYVHNYRAVDIQIIFECRSPNGLYVIVGRGKLGAIIIRFKHKQLVSDAKRPITVTRVTLDFDISVCMTRTNLIVLPGHVQLMIKYTC